jgi:hypothetical protein
MIFYHKTFVIPAKAETQFAPSLLGSRFRGNDEKYQILPAINFAQGVSVG